MGVFSGALYQCDFGAVYLKPTRLLTNVPLARNLLVVGPPQMDEQGNYLGLLQKRDWQGPERLGKAPGSFGTQGSEAWRESYVKRYPTVLVPNWQVILMPRVLKRERLLQFGMLALRCRRLRTQLQARDLERLRRPRR